MKTKILEILNKRNGKDERGFYYILGDETPLNELAEELNALFDLREVSETFKEKNEQTFEAFLDLNFYKSEIFYQSKKTGYLWTRECVLDFYKNKSFIRP